MAVIFGSASTGLAPATRTNSAVPVPASVASGDLIIIALYQESSSAPTAPSGFTELTFSPALNSTGAGKIYQCRVYYKFATGADSGTYTVTHSSRFTAAVCARYTGGPSNIDILGSVGPGTGNGLTVTGTTTVANEVVVGIATQFNSSNNLSSQTGGTPTSTERTDQNNVAIFDGTQATAGSVSSGSLNWSGTGGDTPMAALLGVYTNATIATTPNSIASGAVVPNPTIAATLTATPNSLTTGAVIPSPTVSTTITSSPSAIATGAAVPSPTVTTAVTATPTSITSGAVVPNPTLLFGGLPVATLTDQFDTADTAKWTYGGASNATGGQLHLPNTTGYTSLLSSKVNFKLTGSSISLELVQVVSETFTYLPVAGGSAVLFDVFAGGQIQAGYDNAGRTVVAGATYDPVAHRFLRHRESSGTLYWDVSADGTNWSVFASCPTPFVVDSVTVQFGVGGGTTGDAIFDNINTVPLSPVSIPSGVVVPNPALTVPIPVTPDSVLTGEQVPGPTVAVQQPTTVFIPPYTQRRVPLSPGSALAALMNFGLAVYRVDGQWYEAEFPPPAAFEQADLFFEGGHIHRVDDATAAILIAAGYELSEVFL